MEKQPPCRPKAFRLMRNFLLFLPIGFLLVLSLPLPPTTFADAAFQGRPTLTQTGVLEQAGVSVVRLLASYNALHNNLKTCTALGTIVASWPATSSSERNTWVLTDSAMVAQNGGSCSASSQLATIQVWANNAYTNNATPPVVIAALTCSKGLCRDENGVGTGATEALITSSSAPGGTLFSFHTDGLNTQPYLKSGQAGVSGTGIELANTSGQWPQSSLVGTTPLQDFLTPIYNSSAPASVSSGTQVPTATPIVPEPGMPLVDAQGNLVGMQAKGLSRPFSTSGLGTLEARVPEFQNQTTLTSLLNKNALQTNWVAGIQAYDAKNYTQAAQTLNKIQDLTVSTNTDFQAAKHYAQLATAKEQQPNNGNVTTSGSNEQGSPSLVSYLIGLVAVVFFLVLLLVLVSLLLGRRRTQRDLDKAELARFIEEEAQERQVAEREARRIRESSEITISPSTNRPVSMQTPQIQIISQENNTQTQPLSDNLGDQAIQARLQRLWEQADS